MLAALYATSRAQPADQDLLAEFRAAVRQDNRQAAISLITFPINVTIGGVRVPFANPAELLARYSDVFTPEMRAAIEQGDRKAVGTSRVGGRVRISSLAVPDREETVPAASAAGGSAPRRINVRGGPRPTQLSGALGESPDVFLLFVPQGQFVEVRLERVGRAALVRVSRADTRAALNPRLPNGGLVVSGRPSAAGDYRIEVERTDPRDTGHVPYILSVTMR